MSETNNSNGNAMSVITAAIAAVLQVPVTLSRRVVGSVDVDFSRMSEDTKTYIFRYGITQILNDAKAGESDAKLATGLVEKRLAKLYEGSIGRRAAVSGIGSSDPVEAIAFEIAGDMVKSAMKARGLNLKDHKETVEKMVRTLAAAPHVKEEAERRHAARAVATDNSGDILGGLLSSLLSSTAPVATGNTAEGSTDETGGAEETGDETSPKDETGGDAAESEEKDGGDTDADTTEENTEGGADTDNADTDADTDETTDAKPARGNRGNRSNRNRA